jgi:two-component system OmpR family response regulator
MNEVTEEPKRILVVDDEAEILSVNARTLRAAGFLVDTAEDGELAWQKFSTTPYDLLITDNCMPNLHGLGLVSRLRKTGHRTPVILVSGSFHLDDEMEPELFARLQKPYHLYELVPTARRALSGAPATLLPRRSSSIFALSHAPLLLPPRE